MKFETEMLAGQVVFTAELGRLALGLSLVALLVAVVLAFHELELPVAQRDRGGPALVAFCSLALFALAAIALDWI